MYIYISFWDRSFFNKVFWVIYRFLRVFYVSFWFYFVPFTVIVGSYIIPLMGDDISRFEAFVDNLFEGPIANTTASVNTTILQKP